MKILGFIPGNISSNAWWGWVPFAPLKEKKLHICVYCPVSAGTAQLLSVFSSVWTLSPTAQTVAFSNLNHAIRVPQRLEKTSKLISPTCPPSLFPTNTGPSVQHLNGSWTPPGAAPSSTWPPFQEINFSQHLTWISTCTTWGHSFSPSIFY